MTSTNDGLKQASVRAVTGTTLTYEGDWHALFTLASIAAGTFDERMLLWINQTLATSYTSLPAAQQAMATANSAYNWSSLGTFSGAAAPPVRFVASPGRIMRNGAAATTINTTRFIYDRHMTVGKGGANYMRFVYPGYYTNTNVQETALPNDVTIRVNIQFATATTTVKYQRLLFGGSLTGTIPAGAAQYISDAILPAAFGLATFPAGAVFLHRMEIEVPQGSTLYSGGGSATPAINSPPESGISGGISDGGGTTPTYIDLGVNTLTALNNGTSSNSIGTVWIGSSNRAGPLAVIGTQVTSAPAALGFGDSLMVGVNANLGGDGINGSGGWFIQGIAAAGGVGIPHANCNIGNRGETLALFQADTRRKEMFDYATDVYANYPGTNDFFTSTSIATAKTQLEAQIAYARSRGVQWWGQTAIIPRSSSTDSWATLINQTLFTATPAAAPNDFESKREAWNTLMLGGGITGVDQPIDNMGGIITDAIDPRFWATTGVANIITNDGVHEQQASATLMAAVIAPIAAARTTSP